MKELVINCIKAILATGIIVLWVSIIIITMSLD